MLEVSCFIQKVHDLVVILPASIKLIKTFVLGCRSKKPFYPNLFSRLCIIGVSIDYIDKETGLEMAQLTRTLRVVMEVTKLRYFPSQLAVIIQTVGSWCEHPFLCSSPGISCVSWVSTVPCVLLLGEIHIYPSHDLFCHSD